MLEPAEGTAVPNVTIRKCLLLSEEDYRMCGKPQRTWQVPEDIWAQGRQAIVVHTDV